LVSQPIALTTLNTIINPTLWMGFDCSGGAGSATAVIKFNYLAIRKVYT